MAISWCLSQLQVFLTSCCLVLLVPNDGLSMVVWILIWLYDERQRDDGFEHWYMDPTMPKKRWEFELEGEVFRFCFLYGCWYWWMHIRCNSKWVATLKHPHGTGSQTGIIVVVSVSVPSKYVNRGVKLPYYAKTVQVTYLSVQCLNFINLLLGSVTAFPVFRGYMRFKVKGEYKFHVMISFCSVDFNI